MKNILKTMLFLFTVSAMSITVNAQDKNDMDKILEPFPAATDSVNRFVIYLDEKSDEGAYLVELIPGKVMNVDCNRHRLGGFIAEINLEGWGYTYYEFSTDGQVASTMMACNQPKEDKFISGQTLTVRYNSRMPIVIYAPKGYEIRYRIWQAGEEQVPTEK
ncbi:ecotin [Dysgonomonas hofstadii]|uniref:Ecotin n=1 Tax=Dysgonomonas hofstadii TaxID=637886 RepID=A0A840CZ46_9BACT|nr:serine protease inhibitor ecotin [Dysgonomonas hofstadii]MBB4037223.1 ecotin [Dysgonomonas hofstadii]